MTKRAFTFPGQGSQAIGMGQDLADTFQEARAVFDEVDEALGENLSGLIFEGSEEQLRLTRNAQPALMAVSLAVMRVLEAKGVTLKNNASFVAGHSLGEYSALCAAGTFSLADTARLLRTRGDAMQAAVPVGEGTMAAILGMDFAAVTDLAKNAAHGEICQIANDNAPGQIVISGASSAIERALELAKSAGAKRALLLPVSAPFHCAMMGPAAEAMEQALAMVTMNAPVVPLISNVTAGPVTDPNQIRKNLIAQVTGMVRWNQGIAWLTGDQPDQGNVNQLLEIGAGKVLTGLARRINRDAKGLALGTPSDIDNFVATLASV